VNVVLPSPVDDIPRVRGQWAHLVGAAIRTARGAVAFTIAGSVVLLAVIGPFITPHSPDEPVTTPFAGPSASFLLGSDELGRDVVSRVLAGAWEMLLMALAATALGVLLGAAAGVSAAYLKGAADGLIMRTVDVFLAFPQLVFALLLISIIGPRIWLIILAVGLTHAPASARVLRSAALEISERDYVKSVELQGLRPAKVMRSEILPNLVSPLMVEAGLRFTYSIVLMAGLSFLGFGLPPPAPNWGYMVQENRIGLSLNVWAVAAPALLIALLTIGINTFTDAVARVAIGVERRPE
jgi:peptide/nickel transport system permease protein